MCFACTGTAGVWRISALNEAGGWKDRTTVEDMDLAVRASLKGWKFVFLGDIRVAVLLIRVIIFLSVMISFHFICIDMRVHPLFPHIN